MKKIYKITAVLMMIFLFSAVLVACGEGTYRQEFEACTQKTAAFVLHSDEVLQGEEVKVDCYYDFECNADGYIHVPHDTVGGYQYDEYKVGAFTKAVAMVTAWTPSYRATLFERELYITYVIENQPYEYIDEEGKTVVGVRESIGAESGRFVTPDDFLDGCADEIRVDDNNKAIILGGTPVTFVIPQEMFSEDVGSISLSFGVGYSRPYVHKPLLDYLKSNRYSDRPETVDQAAKSIYPKRIDSSTHPDGNSIVYYKKTNGKIRLQFLPFPEQIEEF